MLNVGRTTGRVVAADSFEGPLDLQRHPTAHVQRAGEEGVAVGEEDGGRWRGRGPQLRPAQQPI